MNHPLQTAEPPGLSVIIVNRNTRALLEDCLSSIAELPDDLRLEVIVVDNASTDDSDHMVETRFPQVRLIRNQANTGFAYPNNQGLSVSRGRHVILLNSDTVVRPFAFQRLVEFMDLHPEVGACGPKLLYPDGQLQPSCRSFPTLWVHFCEMFLLDRLFPGSRIFGNMETWFDHEHTAAVDQPMGAALVVRREVLETVGDLDERFKIQFNDVDWCYRIHRAGWQIYFVHDAEIVHHKGVTTRNENDSMRLQAELTRNAFDYFEKYYGKSGLWWYRFWMVTGWSLRRILCAVPDRLRPTPAGRTRAVFFRGAVRAGWSGDPDQFASAAW